MIDRTDRILADHTIHWGVFIQSNDCNLVFWGLALSLQPGAIAEKVNPAS